MLLDKNTPRNVMGMLGKTGDTTYEVVTVDDHTGAITTMNFAEHAVNEGIHYYIDGYTTLQDAVTTVLNIKLVTPADNLNIDMDFIWSISSSGILQADLYEDATGGMTGGSPVTIFNSDRNSSNTSKVAITSGVTDQTGGTIISKAKWGLNGRKYTSGGTGSRESKIIMKRNTVYLRKFTSSSADNIVQFSASWVEHYHKD